MVEILADPWGLPHGAPRDALPSLRNQVRDAMGARTEAAHLPLVANEPLPGTPPLHVQVECLPMPGRTAKRIGPARLRGWPTHGVAMGLAQPRSRAAE